jgi:hypothetical protein
MELPKFFTITAEWGEERNPEYEKYFHKTKKLMSEMIGCDINSTKYNQMSRISIEKIYNDNREIRLHNITLKPDLQCSFCSYKCSTMYKLLQHMDYQFDTFMSIKPHLRKQYLRNTKGTRICEGRWIINIQDSMITQKISSDCMKFNEILEQIKFNEILEQLKEICIEPPPEYIDRLTGYTSPSHIYDLIIDESKDLDTNISLFIDNNPEYFAIPMSEDKYVIQKNMTSWPFRQS